jgi:GTP 3',8-cyclase
MPENGIQWIPHSKILSYEEISTVVRAGADLGINKIRLTGGEPLVRAELPRLIRMLSEINGIDEISMTTNGTLLKRSAFELKKAGLHRINISLDTFEADKFTRITRLGKLQDTLDGIEAAKNAGLTPVKIDMVVIKGVNDDEVLDFAIRSYEPGWHVRFIELMPLSGVGGLVPVGELRNRIEELGKLEPTKSIVGNGPARYYKLPGAKGTIGFISPITEPFCRWCNRLRLTSFGQLCPCLLSDEGIDLRTPLRSGKLAEDGLKRLIIQSVAAKPEHHKLLSATATLSRKMSQIGG